MDDGDVAGRELHAGVERRKVGVVPFRDGAGENLAEHRAAELQLRIQPRNVVDGHDGAEDRGEVEDRSGRGLQLLVVHRAVGRAEEHGLVDQLLDAAARADRLVVDADVRVQLVVLGKPLRIDRVREGGAGTVDLQRLGAARRAAAIGGNGLRVAAAARGQQRCRQRERDVTTWKQCHEMTV